MKPKLPHVIRLPKSATSPTSSIYVRFDILEQGRVLWSEKDSQTIRSAEPFTLLYKVNGKLKELKSKEEINDRPRSKNQRTRRTGNARSQL